VRPASSQRDLQPNLRQRRISHHRHHRHHRQHHPGRAPVVLRQTASLLSLKHQIRCPPGPSEYWGSFQRQKASPFERTATRMAVAASAPFAMAGSGRLRRRRTVRMMPVAFECHLQVEHQQVSWMRVQKGPFLASLGTKRRVSWRWPRRLRRTRACSHRQRDHRSLCRSHLPQCRWRPNQIIRRKGTRCQSSLPRLSSGLRCSAGWKTSLRLVSRT
jgi:hypothetical protein